MVCAVIKNVYTIFFQGVYKSEGRQGYVVNNASAPKPRQGKHGGRGTINDAYLT